MPKGEKTCFWDIFNFMQKMCYSKGGEKSKREK